MKTRSHFMLAGLILSLLWTGGVLRAQAEDTLNQLRLTSEQVPGLGSLTSEAIHPGNASDPSAPRDRDILDEYGVVSRVDRAYASPQGEVRTLIYVMKDFKAAFGL